MIAFPSLDQHGALKQFRVLGQDIGHLIGRRDVVIGQAVLLELGVAPDQVGRGVLELAQERDDLVAGRAARPSTGTSAARHVDPEVVGHLDRVAGGAAVRVVEDHDVGHGSNVPSRFATVSAVDHAVSGHDEAAVGR